MPTMTFTCDKEHSVTNAPGNYGNSKDDHAPVGYNPNTGWRYRDLLHFPLGGLPAGARLVSATLKMKTTAGVHMQHGSAPTVSIRRLTESFAASGGSGETWQTSANPAGFTTSSTTADEVVWGPGNNDQTVYSKNIIGIVEDQAPTDTFRRSGSACGGTNYGILLRSPDESEGNYRIEFQSIRGGYAPRLEIEYTLEDDPEQPTITSPANGANYASQAAADAIVLDFPAGDGTTRYSLDFGTTLDGSQLLTKSQITTGMVGKHIEASYAALGGAAMPAGVPIYFRVRGWNSTTYGPWARSTFMVAATPTATLVSPLNNGLAHIHNLGELAVWTDAGLHAKPRVTVGYTHPTGLSCQAVEVDIGGTVEAFTGLNVASGGQVVVNCAKTLQRNTLTTFKVRAQASDGTWSAWAPTTTSNSKVQWGQGVYAFSPGASASALLSQHAALQGGSATQVAYAYRNTASGGWKVNLSEVTPGTSMEMLVRLSTSDAAQVPLLPSAKVQWQASASPPPDHWEGWQCSVSLDPTMRRFGERSLKVTPSATEWEVFNPEGYITVTPGAKYTVSAYVNTLGPLGGSGTLGIRLYGADGATVVDDWWEEEADTTAVTTDSSAHPDGWQRIFGTFTAEEDKCWPVLYGAGTSKEVRLDSAQFEQGPVASQWKPGGLGPAVILDVGGIVVDGSEGGIFRLRTSSGSIIDLRSDGLYQDGVRMRAGLPPKTTILTASGSWTRTGDPLWVEIEAVGPGGGSGGAGATAANEGSGGTGGGGGAYCKKTLYGAAIPSTAVTVTVGTGGAGGTAGANPGAAGSGPTTVVHAGTGLNMSAGAGGGGLGIASGGASGSWGGGTAGNATGGDINLPGQQGGTLSRAPTTNAVTVASNFGGASHMGFGGYAGYTSATAGASAVPFGYGGGGGGPRNGQSSAASAGGPGAPGVVIITEYY